MNSSFFADLIAKKRSADGEVKVGWGATAESCAELGASAIGDARRAKAGPKVSASDLIDLNGVDVYGTVIGVSKGMYSHKVAVIVSKVEMPDDSVSTVVVPSGAVYQVASKKLPHKMAGGEKVTMPHVFPAACFLVRIDGVLNLDVKTTKNGPKDAELTAEAIPIGTKAKFTNVVFDYVHKAATEEYPESHSAYGSAKGIDYDENFVKGPIHPILGKQAVFDALSWGSSGMHSHVITTACDHIGVRPDHLLEQSRADKLAIAEFLEKTADAYNEASVGVGQAWASPLFSEGAVDDWRATAAAMREDDVVSLNPLLSNKNYISRRSHVTPFVQYAIDPFIAELTSRDTTGVSFKLNYETNAEAVEIVGFNPAEANNVKAFTECTLRLAPDKCVRPDPTTERPDPPGRSLESIASESMGSVAIDVASFGDTTMDPATKTFNPPTLMKLADGTSLIISQFLDSAKKGKLLNAFGVYDYYRFSMLAELLLPYMGLAFFTNNWSNSRPVEALTCQPRVVDKNFSTGDGIANVYFVAPAIKAVGVQVSVDFLKEHVVDDENCLLVPSVPDQYKPEDNSKPPKQIAPEPPQLGKDGFLCLNGLEGTNVNRASVKKLPEGSDGFEIYVLYADCVADVKAAVKRNQDAATGEAFLKEKFGDALQAKLANTCAIYCVSTPAPVKTDGSKKARVA